MSITLTPIGKVVSCFTDKFGIPRQSGLAPAASGQIVFDPPYQDPEAFVGLEGVSHLWVQFMFHRNRSAQWKPRVKPPRLGGNKTLGVFATRSPMRPNALGLSVVKLEGIMQNAQGVSLAISGHDLLDGTPVLDIKPYLPYADSIANAQHPLAATPPPQLAVSFTPQAEAQCQVREKKYPALRELIIQLLQQDPRPQYQQPDPQRHYGIRLWDLDIHWCYQQQGEAGWWIEVVGILNTPPPTPPQAEGG